MFCQLEVLRHCLTPSIREQLNELPRSLDGTYKRVLREIQSMNQGRHARRLLHCLAVAFWPLCVEELAEVLAINLNVTKEETPTFHLEWQWENQEQAVLSACFSFVSIVKSGDYRFIQFPHFLVKEYLTSDHLAAASNDISQYHILPEPAHLMLVHACLGVLLHLDHCVNEGRGIDSGLEDQEDIPLQEYAANHWASHAQVRNILSHLKYGTETLFDPDKPFFLAWIKKYSLDDFTFWRSYATSFTPIPLYYAALCGLYDLVQHLIVKHLEQVNHHGDRRGSPLVAALSEKHFQVGTLLVQHSAHVNVHGDPPLCHTIRLPDYARVDAVHFLLEHGTHVNAREKNLQTPLHVAASVGCPQVIRILLDHRADINLRDHHGQLPLHIVSTSTTFEGEIVVDKCYIVAQLLLQHCADMDAQNMCRETPLHSASYHGRLKISWLLLDYGANPCTEDEEGQSPLHHLLLGVSGV